MKTLVTLLFAALSLCAGDVTGKWSGSVTLPDGAPTEHTVFMVLKQEGTTFSGTAGGEAHEQLPITKARVEGETYSFELPTEGALFKVAMRMEGENALMGDVIREADGQTEKYKFLAKRVTQ